jgi:Zn-dependent protease with chaperone function
VDFFAAQAQARRASRRLLLWFSVAVAASIGIVYLALALLLAGDAGTLWQPPLLLLVAVLVGGVILGGSAYKTASLAAGGGQAVATSLGGLQIARATTDPAERRLVNIVDEMAIAAGIPAPPVYVLPQESAINAFAAGRRPNEAVVAVTRGALDKLSRDELQGVVAHEFSHILNGDMALNLRLIGVLHGLMMLALAGRVLLRSGGRGVRDKDRGGIVLLGLALVAAGYVGVLAGRLIRAAVSRQREFLADASAVQFTRNPRGIAGALRRIAAEAAPLGHARAEEVSHMLLDAGFSGWLATHPPLAERIARLENRAVELDEAPVLAPAVSDVTDATLAPGFAAQIGAHEAGQLAAAETLIEALPEALRTTLTSVAGARAASLALLLSRNPEQRQRQLGLLSPEDAAAVDAALPPGLAPGLRLPVIELALGPLREMGRDARAQFMDTADALARADGRVTLSEYILLRLLRDALLPHSPAPFLVVPAELGRHVALLLSLLAYAGQREASGIQTAFARGMAMAPVDNTVLVPLNEISTAAFDRALEILADATPGYRRRLVEALAATAWHDGRLAVPEEELLAAICSALNCPVPLHPVGDDRIEKVGVGGTALSLVATPNPQADDWLAADRLPLQALILANLMPIPGVLFFGWDARSLLLLYWMENLVIGGYTLLRMLRADGWRALGVGAFFSFHYGFFCGGHGMVLMGLSGIGEGGVNDPLGPYMGEEWPAFFVPFQMIWAILHWVWAEQPGLLGLPLLGFIVSHGLSTATHHFIADEDGGRRAEQIMNDPYRRIVVLHIALIAGAFAIILSGGGTVAPILLALIALKIGFDIHQHRAVHRARQGIVV